jgi:2-amino-4-hydroxy-6-hydroxymethyldihydropteridine diphosphokinase
MALTPSHFANGLPEWARVGSVRDAHIERVVALIDEWGVELGWSDAERDRLRAAAWLHDALRDAPADELRPLVSDELRDLPDKLLHGPAAAARARADGLDDEEVLQAVTYHTIGHPDLGFIGRMLYLADFLEPGRRFDPAGRAALRARMPHEWRIVIRSVVRARVNHLLDSSNPVRPETMSYWNSAVMDRSEPG